MSAKITYKTKLSIEECVFRLKTNAKKPKLFSIRGYPAGTVIYSLKGTSLKLKATLGEYMSNSFEPIFYGSLERMPDGTVIRGKFAMHTSTRIFMAVWFVFVAAFFVLTVWAAFIAPAAGYEPVDRVPYWVPLVPAIMLIFGFLLVRSGQRLGTGQSTAVVKFLNAVLEAAEQPNADDETRPVRPIE